MTDNPLFGLFNCTQILLKCVYITVAILICLKQVSKPFQISEVEKDMGPTDNCTLPLEKVMVGQE